MRFFLISEYRSTTVTFDLLQASCTKFKIEPVVVRPSEFHWRTDKIDIKQDDLLYQITIDAPSSDLEMIMLQNNPTTFFESPAARRLASDTIFATLIHDKNNLPMPTTLYHFSSTSSQAGEAIESLGGFPVVIKVVGGSHGLGVMKIDSLESLNSVTDFLNANNIRYVLRSFIKASQHARLIVLGQRVIDSIAYLAPEGDFRTNAQHIPIVKPQKFSVEMEELAVKATRVLGLEFAGVDIIEDQQGHPYLLEVNFPCYFPRVQKLTGTPISDYMVEYLIQKSKKRQSKI